MSFTEEEKKKALQLYDETGSIAKVIHNLGYPSRQNMYTWIKNRNIEKKHKEYSFTNSPDHRIHPSLETKLEILHRCFEEGEDIKSISEEYGYSRTSIYSWRKLYSSGGAAAIMNKKKDLPRGTLIVNEDADKGSDNNIELAAKIRDLELENDILRQTIEILKKDQGIDLLRMKNAEKTMIIDALRNKYALSLLLAKLQISKSSYFYQHKIQQSPYKYEAIKVKIIKLFKENKERYGYRRIHSRLRKDNIIVSEKIVRQIMKDNNLVVKVRKHKKYSSYQGEISEAARNIINRDFHSEKPNEKVLTDITEFSIPAGKVYLSPIVDCFDGMIPSWTVSTNPNADLVNSMLDDYHSKLKEDDKPIVHSDRGCHYRWPGWINRMNKYGYTRSMSKKGCSPDNSACEGFFGRMKNEMFYGRNFVGVTIETFIEIINDYIIWYNTKRIKATLGYLSPMEYRQSLGLI